MEKNLEILPTTDVPAAGYFFCLLKKISNISKEDVKMVNDETFSVKSNNVSYITNAKNGCCSCPVGLYGRFCKHQYAVFHHFDIASRNFPPVLPADKH